MGQHFLQKKKQYGQYTGLHDENGKEIYENDIVYVSGEDENAIIEWDEETARFIIHFDGWIADFDNYYGKELEVRGDKYNNPELLGGEQICKRNVTNVIVKNYSQKYKEIEEDYFVVNVGSGKSGLQSRNYRQQNSENIKSQENRYVKKRYKTWQHIVLEYNWSKQFKNITQM